LTVCWVTTSTKDKENVPPLIWKQYTKYAWEENLLWYKGRIAVTEDKGIRLILLEQHHHSVVTGHQDRQGLWNYSVDDSTGQE
jgi:hypothetical protein